VWNSYVTADEFHGVTILLHPMMKARECDTELRMCHAIAVETPCSAGV
jgi:hypothetical protein